MLFLNQVVRPEQNSTRSANAEVFSVSKGIETQWSIGHGHYTAPILFGLHQPLHKNGVTEHWIRKQLFHAAKC
jgi:hypothetical protein